MARRGLLLILSSPSGAGKSTLAKQLMAWDPAIRFSISATTRAPRPGEVNGKDYYFVSRDDFLRQAKDGEMLEHAEVFENFYGSPRAPVAAALENGKDVLFDVDWQGGQQIRQAMRDDAVLVFVLPPTIAELEKRLKGRAQDSAEVVAKRMAKSRDEISHWAEYDYVLVNDATDQCLAEVHSVLSAERLKRWRQSGLVAFVRDLIA